MSTQLSDNARQVLESRYLLRDSSNKLIESPEQMFRRVAHAVAQGELLYGSASATEKWESRFYELISNLHFLPNSPTLMNAGKPEGQLSACFVLPVEDSLDKIFETLKNAALIQQSGGGTGFDFSRLRPKGSWIKSTGGLASGPVSFMKIFDCATQHIKQGGKRRGANMGVLNARHPDIVEFIECKKKADSLHNFNISVAVEDSFMQAVNDDEYWELQYPESGNRAGQIKARKLWKLLIENAWEQGDPGLLFMDRINADNPTPLLGAIEATNPCGEMPLLPFESCNLGSVNLSLMVHSSNGGKPEVNWKLLEDIVFTAVRFLDNVIDINHYLLYETKLVTQGNRKIGLGVMGWAEMLIKLGIPYATNQAVELAGRLMEFIMYKSRRASEELAISRGPFPNWSNSIYKLQKPLRNATRTSIAPTGSISIIANTSSSIEPLFALAFHRENILERKTLVEINSLFIDHLDQKKMNSGSLMSAVQQTGTLPENSGIPKSTKQLFQTALEIPFENHLKHQMAFQKYTDNAVSKTINLPNNCGQQEVSRAYKIAWQTGAKGITVFRSGCKGAQVLNVGRLPDELVHPRWRGNPCIHCSE